MNLKDILINIYLAKPGSGGTLAYLKLTFPLEIDGRSVTLSIGNYRVMQSHFGLKPYKVLPPTIYSSNKGKYNDIVFLSNPDVWFKLEQIIIDQYLKVTKNKVFNQGNDTS